MKANKLLRSAPHMVCVAGFHYLDAINRSLATARSIVPVTDNPVELAWYRKPVGC